MSGPLTALAAIPAQVTPPTPLQWLATVLLVGVGCSALVPALASLNRLRRVAFTRVSEPGGVDPGVVEVFAPVEAATDTLTAPLSGADCVAHAVQVERRRSVPGVHRLGWWENADATGVLTPFYLADDSGRVLVRPEAWLRDADADPAAPATWRGDSPGDLFTDLELVVDERRRLDPGETLPDGVRETLDGDGTPDADHRRRVTEWRVATDDELYVVGPAVQNTDGAFDAELAVENHGGTFILSERPQWRTALDRLARAFAFAVVAVTMLWVAGLRSGVV